MKITEEIDVTAAQACAVCGDEPPGGVFRTLKIRLQNRVYVLGREMSEELLAALDKFGDDCAEGCKVMREDLRAALAYRVGDPRPEFRSPDLAAAAEEVEAADGGPVCWACEKPGEAAGDDLWVCRTKGCPREGRPAAAEYFETGVR